MVDILRFGCCKTACNSCHHDLGIHGGRRKAVKLCVTCHNASTVDPDTGNTVDMAVMTHRIHAASMLSSPYELGGHDYSEVTYPQEVINCRKCHNEESPTFKPFDYAERVKEVDHPRPKK